MTSSESTKAMTDSRLAAAAGAVLAATGSTGARAVLTAAALAGLVTAMPLWIPAGVVIGAAAVLLGETDALRHARSAHPV